MKGYQDTNKRYNQNQKRQDRKDKKQFHNIIITKSISNVIIGAKIIEYIVKNCIQQDKRLTGSNSINETKPDKLDI